MNADGLHRRAPQKCFIATGWLALLLALGCFSTEAQATQQHSTLSQRGQVFLRGHIKRFQGSLLVAQRRPYGGYHLRRVPTRQLYDDINRIQGTILKYEHLNNPHMPSMAGPVTLVVVGGAGLVVGIAFTASLALQSIFFSTATISVLAAVLFLTIGAAVLAAGIIWLIINIRKRRQSPYYPKIRKLKIIQKAILLELRQRRNNSYSALPPVLGHTFTFAF